MKQPVQHFAILAFFLFFSAKGLSLPLPNGSTAPDFTLTDVNGVEHHLYDYLDQGYTVFLDFSATWCGICWNYHNTNILKDIYNQYGPSGTDQVMVLFIEGDAFTPESALFGGSGSQGDWVTGTPYPVMDDPNETVASAYQVFSFPTLYAVCPDRKVYQPGSGASFATWENWIASCALSQTSDVTDISCNGQGNGAIDLDVSGGFGALTYSWNTGAATQDLSGLSGGMYSCIISDQLGRFIQTDPILVNEPEALGATLDVYSESFYQGNDGAIFVYPEGGTPPYEYLWSNGASSQNLENLSPGAYSLTLTDLYGCQQIQNASIAPYVCPNISIQVFTSDVACAGDASGEASINPAGGSFPYTVQWSDGGTGLDRDDLPAGAYQITLTDAFACPVETTLDISEPNPLSVSVLSQTDASCDGQVSGSANLSASGGVPGYAYSWPDGQSGPAAQGLVPGAYDVSVTDQNQCLTIFEVVIAALDDTQPPVVATQDVVVSLDENGQAALDPQSADGGSMDDCAIGEYALSQTAFTCDDLGVQTLTLTVTDAGGNQASAPLQATVVDAIAPSIVCPPNVVFHNCDGVATFDQPQATDNCGVQAVELIAGLPSGGTFPLDQPQVQVFRATDASGNTAECSFEVVFENTLTSSSQSENSCPGMQTGTAAVIPQGGTPDYTATWNTGATGLTLEALSPGTYFATIVDATGCTVVQPVQVGSWLALVFQVEQVLDANTGQADGAVYIEVSGGEAPYSFSWATIGGQQISESEDLLGIPAGTYVCHITDANGCQMVSLPITVKEIVVNGIQQTVQPSVRVYPNPAQEYVVVEGFSNGMIQLYDGMGRLRIYREVEAGQAMIALPLTALESGYYWLAIGETRVPLAIVR